RSQVQHNRIKAAKQRCAASRQCDPAVKFRQAIDVLNLSGPTQPVHRGYDVNAPNPPVVPIGTPAAAPIPGVRWPIDKHAEPVCQGPLVPPRPLAGAAPLWS